jgi:putative transposase
MRRGFIVLSAIVQMALQQSPFSGHVFVFRGRRGDLIKLLNAYCERLIGTMRRECLDFMMPLNERQLRAILRSWVAHYNKGRPHSSLGPGIPEKSGATPLRLPRTRRHTLPPNCRIRARDIVGGLHDEYWLERCVA